MTREDLEQMLERLEMAASVQIPADQARELIRLALMGLDLDEKKVTQ